MTSLSTSTPSQSKMTRSKFTKLGFVFVERDAIQFQPVIDQLVAELAGDLGYKLVDHRLELYCVPLDDDSKS